MDRRYSLRERQQVVYLKKRRRIVVDPTPRGPYDTEEFDVTACLPDEVLEHIFGFLSGTDLGNCSKVSVKWHNVANGEKLWSRLYKAKFGWDDPYKLAGIESSFKKNEGFQSVRLSKRLTPVPVWKLDYCRQQFLSHNWRKGRFVTRTYGKNVKLLRYLTFCSSEPQDRLLLPVVERFRHHFEFNVLKIDGKPTKVGQLESTKLNEISIVCVNKNRIAYIVDRTLKIVDYVNKKFQDVLVFKLSPCHNGLVNCQTHHTEQHFIKMDSNHVIFGHKNYYFLVWSLEKSKIVGFKESPKTNAIINVISLKDDTVYISISNTESKEFDVHEYDIPTKELEHVCSITYHVRNVLSNDKFIVCICSTAERHSNVEQNVIMICNLSDRTVYQKLCISYINYMQPTIVLSDNELFYPSFATILAVDLPSRATTILFNVDQEVFKLYHPCQDMIVVRSPGELEFWNRNKGTISYRYRLCFEDQFRPMFFDTTRCVFLFDGKLQVHGFW